MNRIQSRLVKLVVVLEMFFLWVPSSGMSQQRPSHKNSESSGRAAAAVPESQAAQPAALAAAPKEETGCRDGAWADPNKRYSSAETLERKSLLDGGQGWQNGGEVNRADRRGARWGILYGAAAYGSWGFIPLYFKTVAGVAPLEVLAHRALWSFCMLAVLVGLLGRWGELWLTFLARRRVTDGKPAVAQPL